MIIPENPTLDWECMYQKLEAENARLRQALEEIAYGEFSHQYETDIAKAALEK